MFKIFTLSLLLTIVTLADAPLLKTGQTTSFAEFDDGHYQAGADRDYDNTAKPGIVVDNVTRLEWQDDYSDNGENVVSKSWVTQLNYDEGNYFDTSGDTAATYCMNLSLDGGGWRLPTRKELQGIVDYGRLPPTIDPKFINVSSDYYWSSTSNAYGSIYAWNVSFNIGYQDDVTKNSIFYVRCVRAGQ